MRTHIACLRLRRLRRRLNKEKYDPNVFEDLDFIKRHTRYREFHGKFDDEEFYCDENLFLLYPPANRARPSNCIQFQVIRLSSETKLDDDVVGWGVFPIMNSELKFNEGRFKIPLLQGRVDQRITLYREIEKGYMTNLDDWLCNMYFEVEPLEIQKMEFDFDDHRILIPKERLNQGHGAHLRKERPLQLDLDGTINKRLSQLDRTSQRSSMGKKKDRNSANLLSNLNQSLLDRNEESKVPLNREETNILNSVLNEEKEQLTKQMEMDIRDGLDDSTLMLETYQYTVADKFNYETRNVSRKKLVYIFTESLSDMGLKNLSTVAFQITLFVIILSFWARVYVHYFGEYLALLMLGIPVSVFEAKWYTVDLQYEPWVLAQEMLVISMGVLLNSFLFF